MSEQEHHNDDLPYDIPHYAVTFRHRVIAVYWLVSLGIVTYLGGMQALKGVNHMLHEIHALGGH